MRQQVSLQGILPLHLAFLRQHFPNGLTTALPEAVQNHASFALFQLFTVVCVLSELHSCPTSLPTILKVPGLVTGGHGAALGTLQNRRDSMNALSERRNLYTQIKVASSGTHPVKEVALGPLWD